MKKEVIKDLLKDIFFAIVIVIVLINYVLIPCVVEGSSMYDTLHENDYGYSFIFTRKIAINRFDIAVIMTGNDMSSKLLVKRVIGLPNETIEYKDNRLYVNGEYVEEDFLKEVTTGDFTAVLSDDEYFCLGDNRNVSRDSRFYGPFSGDKIVSTHLFVIYPLSSIGFKK